MDKTLICYAEGRPDGRFEAVCINYDLAVEGRSIDDVIEKLRAAVTDYLAYVESLPEHERSRFLNRKIPLIARLKFIYWAVVALVFSKRRDDLQRHEFTLPCVA